MADWMAVTLTQALEGMESEKLFRPERKKKYRRLLQKYGAGLTFPTKFIEEKKIRTPLDITILKGGIGKSKKEVVRLI